MPEFRSRPRTPPAGPGITVVVGLLLVVAAAVVILATTASMLWKIAAAGAGMFGLALFVGGAIRRAQVL